MRVNLPHTLSALRAIAAAQLKAMYDALAAVVNGNLGRENFAPRAGFGNAQKAAPRSWVALEGQLYHPFAGNGGYGDPTVLGSGPSVLRWKIPELAPARRKGTIKVACWSAWLGGVNGTPQAPAPWPGVNGGSVKLRHTPKGGAAATKDTANAYTVIPTYAGRLFRRDVAEFEVSPGDVLEVQVTDITFSGIGTNRILGFGAAVWLKMEHLP
jgi:hypothetical protein